MFARKNLKDIQPEDYVSYVLNFDLPNNVGEKYVYNNAETFLLSVFFQEEFGLNIKDFIAKELFGPLNIQKFVWDNYGKYCPGATGLFLSHADLFKVGKLILQKGLWEGKQIISDEFIHEMCSTQIETPYAVKSNRILPKMGVGFVVNTSFDGWIFKDGTNSQYLIFNFETNQLITIFSNEEDMTLAQQILKDVICGILYDEKYQYLNKIKGSQTWYLAELVGGGWSADLKFKVFAENGEKLLLRVSDIKTKEKKEKEYNALCQVDDLGILVSKPYRFGIVAESGKVFMILGWIEGKNVEQSMPNLTLHQQYVAGVEAGKILRKMHSLPSELSKSDWKEKNLKVLHERTELYRGLNYKIEHFDEIMKFINSNINLLDNRKLTFHHGDYQGRNIIVSDDCKVGVIDFERTSSGDPFEEFNRMMIYTRRFSETFCCGQIDGYFGEEQIPEEFWKVVAFHASMKLLMTIIYGVATGSSVTESGVIRVRIFVSVSKPAPCCLRLFAAIISRFFFRSFLREFSSMFSVSIENPHKNCPSFLCSPRYWSMSSVCSRTMDREASVFFTFSLETEAGR